MQQRVVRTAKSACPHDCPSACALEVPVLADGHIARGYAGCFDVTPDWHPILDRVGPDGYFVAAGFSGHGFKLSPAVGHMVATLLVDGPDGHPDLPIFRLSRFAEGKPIRGTYGDWLMC